MTILLKRSATFDDIINSSSPYDLVERVQELNEGDLLTWAPPYCQPCFIIWLTIRGAQTALNVKLRCVGKVEKTTRTEWGDVPFEKLIEGK